MDQETEKTDSYQDQLADLGTNNNSPDLVGSEGAQSNDYVQQNGRIDDISDKEAPRGINLGAAQITPNLAKDSYFGTQNGEMANAPLDNQFRDEKPTSGFEMQYPSYDEAKGSSFNFTRIFIILLISFLVLGGVSLGIYYFLNRSKTAEKTEEIDLIKKETGEETSPSILNEDKEKDIETQKENNSTQTQPEVSPQIEQPKIESKQPEIPQTDETGSVEGRG